MLGCKNKGTAKDRLYRDYTHCGSGYVTWNLDLLAAIYNAKIELSEIRLLVFLEIAMPYDKNRNDDDDDERQERALSYAEFAKKYNLDDTGKGVKKAIAYLMEKKLIKCLNKGTRAGRTKLEYEPNVKYLHKLLKAYIQNK